MYRAQILSPWSGTGEPGDTQVPQVSVDYGPQSEAANTIYACSAVTGELSALTQEKILGVVDPNLTVVDIECEQAAMTDIQADATYHVLWSEEITDAP